MRHRFHSICPYFAMFPESFASRWISRLTRRGETVLDPFSGRGTTALTSSLAGRKSISCDVNDVAYCLTKAKTNPPKLGSLLNRLRLLEASFDEDARWSQQREQCPEFFHRAYAPSTLSRLLYLRDALNWKSSRVDSMIAALVLGSLHGESHSPNYFSNQMPRTISTKPAYSVRFWESRGLIAPDRDVFSILRGRANYRYASDPPDSEALVFHGDMRTLPQRLGSWTSPIRCVITSPPYMDVTSFEEDQWLRLWFLGGPPNPTRGRVSRDDRYTQRDPYWQFIGDMWRSLGAVLDKAAHIVIRIGARAVSPKDLTRTLRGSAELSGRAMRLVSSNVSQLKNRQTDVFRPGSKGCGYELDCHFLME